MLLKSTGVLLAKREGPTWTYTIVLADNDTRSGLTFSEARKILKHLGAEDPHGILRAAMDNTLS